MNSITSFLYNVLSAINGVVNNYGVAIIIFTILMRFICLPFDYRSRKSMRKMATFQPKLDALQKKYGDDKEKLQKKQAQLMREEHYSPLSGCLPMLLTWPLMFAMFAAMRSVAYEKLVEQVFKFLSGSEAIVTSQDAFLWIKNIWMSDSPFTSIAPDTTSLQIIGADVWQKVFQQLSDADMEAILANIANYSSDLVLNAESFSAENYTATVNAIMGVLGQMDTYRAAVDYVAGWHNIRVLIVNVTLYKDYNGLLILPILAGVTQILQTKLNPQAQNQNTAPTTQNSQTKGMSGFMTWFFPIISIYFCLSSNAGFSIYWVTSNVVIFLQSIGINKYFEALDKKEAAQKAAKESERSWSK